VNNTISSKPSLKSFRALPNPDRPSLARERGWLNEKPGEQGLVSGVQKVGFAESIGAPIGKMGKPQDWECSRPRVSEEAEARITKRRNIEIGSLLVTMVLVRKILTVPEKEFIFSQGDRAETVYYVQKGKVRLTVVSRAGKEATIGIVDEGHFFGEGSLAGQLFRLSSATAMTDCTLLEVEKNEMKTVLHREPVFSDLFVAYLLARNMRYEEDLIDQLSNYSEKRLARVLLLLAHFGKDGGVEAAVPKISQETIAEMIGSSRSRVNFFMNRFKRLGFIRYDGTLHVHSSLLSVVLREPAAESRYTKPARRAES
jgi:CRP/FNR family transcriptional regulator, cyclic AMP receptor protein